ncbi:MAG: glycoside hydrolase family 127 protein [Bacteroidota bacterium]|nr:glycoside hydrolase family 127 protein [Bacteroidota bacterium]
MLYTAEVLGQSHYPGQQAEKITLKDNIRTEATAFDLQDVRLLNSPFRQNMERSSRWLLSLPVNSLLHSFRTNAGIFSGREGGYFVTKKLAGWESLDCDLRGHTTGHVLSALALQFASTGNELYKSKADSLVKGLAEVQAALNQSGYLSAYPQQLINRNIAGQGVWAPWYTQHKILSGLIDQYLYCDNKQALDVAKKMATWAYNKLKPLTAEQRTVMLRNEFGGINDSFYNLYAITGNPDDRWLAEFFYHKEVLEPLQQGEDNLNTKHANTFIPKLIGLVRDYELEGNPVNLKTADFFWHTVVNHHIFCTGSNSDKEHFFLPDHQSEHLSGYTGESCNVYNLLKLTRHLFCIKPDVVYADYYEKALYNHILGQQDDKTGMIAYFLPMLPGAHKVYSTPDSSFWCCVGTSFESQAKFGEAIYYKTSKGLIVNLFIPSILTWKERGLVVRQETAFPENGTTKLLIEQSGNQKTTIAIRYPSWAIWGATVKINGKKIALRQQPGSYIELNRTWKAGDNVEINYTMRLHLVNTPDNPDLAAIAYGPIILAGEMGTEGMQKPAPYSDPTRYNDYYTYQYHIPAGLQTTLKLGRETLEKQIIPETGQDALTFKIVNEDIILAPLYRIHRQRYIVYWTIKERQKNQ